MYSLILALKKKELKKLILSLMLKCYANCILFQNLSHDYREQRWQSCYSSADAMMANPGKCAEPVLEIH